MRRQRADAPRHALVGLALTAAVVLGASSGIDVGGRLVPAAADGHLSAVEEPVVTVVMVGDLLLGRHVERVTERRGADALFVEIHDELDGDYVTGNLEQVVSDATDLPAADKLIHLRSGTSGVAALRAAGFTTLSLANNHTMDHGIPGLRDTIAALDAAGLDHVGAGEDLEAARAIAYADVGPVTIATVAFTDVFVEGFPARAFQGGVLTAAPEVVVPVVQRAAATADLVVAHVHFGQEYDLRVRDRQRDIAELVAAAGADILVGHHPHVLLPVERIDDTLVLYSLGNFVFDQGWSRTRESAIARYELMPDGTARLSLVPVYIQEATPRYVDGVLGGYRRARIEQRLRGAGLEWERDGDRLITTIDHGHVLTGERP